VRKLGGRSCRRADPEALSGPRSEYETSRCFCTDETGAASVPARSISRLQNALKSAGARSALTVSAGPSATGDKVMQIENDYEQGRLQRRPSASCPASNMEEKRTHGRFFDGREG